MENLLAFKISEKTHLRHTDNKHFIIAWFLSFRICAHCGFSCHDVFELGMHYGLVHPHVDMSKICGICGITSSNESGLIKHKQIHSNFNTKHMS